ncbi:MAG: ROK family protein [Pyrinomonadaceae bacterium]
MSDVILAVDLGGTNIRMGAVREDGEILSLARENTPSSVGPAELLDVVGRLSEKCRVETGDGFRVQGIGLAAPTPAPSNNDGTFGKLPNIPSLNGWTAKAAIETKFSFPLTLENDATAAAIGENWLGASREVRSSILVTLGTGIGGGIIVDGKPVRGVDGTAGEIGHICVEPDGHNCGCGSHGCVEQYASASGILRMARESGLTASTAAEVFELTRTGDERARNVFTKMGVYLGIALAALVNTLNPEMIVLTGGVAAGWDAFINPLRLELKARAFPAPAERARIVRSELGGNAGLLGVSRSAFLANA